MNLPTEFLPNEFQTRMEKLLGEEYPSFLKSYEEPRRYGLRVNTLKISVDEFRRIAPFHLTRIPWIDSGFFYEKDDLPSRHPFYYAGLYYLQEPSAMTPAQVLPVEPGDRVLDLCAAPGGKATALAEKLQGQGLLVANDISASRAKALLKNLEIFGVANSVVTSTSPFRLSRQFPDFFDKILVDAPCSGEGMFRKDIASAKDWSLSKVQDCAKRQKEIVLQAVSMLRPGGIMLYSTCTFSPEEDEQVIAYILDNCPDMELLPVSMAEGFESGRPELAMDEERKIAPQDYQLNARLEDSHDQAFFHKKSDRRDDLKKCVRLFPHKVPGEGHFLALLKKRETVMPEPCPNSLPGSVRNVHKKDRKRRASAGHPSHTPEETALAVSFLKETFMEHSEEPGNRESHLQLSALMDKMEFHGSCAYYVPEALNILQNQKDIQILRRGLYLGEVQKNRFEPSQALAMTLCRTAHSATLNFDFTDERIMRYLRGETIEIPDSTAANGWKLICVNGYPLGWGKLVNGTLKNKYHPGWRAH